jgi:hypothetical protein
MNAGKQPGEAVPRSPDVAVQPVVLVLVEDTIGSLAALLLAAEIAVHQTVARLVRELSPAAVVIGMPHRPRLLGHRSVARWLIGRTNVRAVVVPA